MPTLGTLIRHTLSFCNAYWKPLFIGIIVVSFLTYGLGIPMSYFVQKWEAADAFARQSGQAAQPIAMNEVIMVIGAWILSMIVSLVGMVYFFAVSIIRTKSFREGVRRAFTLAFPFLGLCFWIWLRSYLWVPLLMLIGAVFLAPVYAGILALAALALCLILALIFIPRFICAPVYFIRQGKSITQSVQESWIVTKGTWPTVTGFMFAIAVMIAMLMFGGLLFIFLTASIISIMIPLLSAVMFAFGMALIPHILLVFQTVFMVKLGEAVMNKGAAVV